MNSRFRLKKERLSTKDRFITQLRRDSSEYDSENSPWYRQRSNYLVLLMIFVFFIMAFVVKTLFTVNQDLAEKSNNQVSNEQQLKKTPTPDNEMDYEKAKRIFRGIDN